MSFRVLTAANYEENSDAMSVASNVSDASAHSVNNDVMRTIYYA